MYQKILLEVAKMILVIIDIKVDWEFCKPYHQMAPNVVSAVSMSIGETSTLGFSTNPGQKSEAFEATIFINDPENVAFNPGLVLSD